MEREMLVLERHRRGIGVLPADPQSLVTLNEFKRLLKDGEKADLVDGVMVMASPASRKHERLFNFLYTLINMFVQIRELGEVYGSRTLIELDDKNGYEPDICFVARSRLGIVKEQSIVGAPNVVVEIVSPGSRHYDAFVKKEGYARLRVPEYWLIDPDNRVVEFYQLRVDEYVEAARDSEVYHSAALSGLHIRREWLWENAAGQLPKVVDILRELKVL